MAFADYLDLRTAVLEHVARPDIADVFPRLVKLAEAALNRRLRLRDMVTDWPVSFSSGLAPIPDDFLEAIGLFDASGREYVQQPLRAVRGSGAFYAVEGDWLRSQGIQGDCTLQYYAAIPTLTASNTTSNWLLERYPSVYLYAVGLEAAKYIRDVELAQTTRIVLDDEIASVQADDTRARYARARVRVQGMTP